MTELPLVSICAINYNNEKYVIETLDSIKGQTYRNYELIIVDDCSTDNSLVLIKEWLKTYAKPYKLIVHEVNKGVCATCNDGLRNASGKYFSLIATDDIMLPDKTHHQVELLERSSGKVGAVYSDAYLMQENSMPMYGWFIQRYRQDFVLPPSGNIYKDILKKNFIPAMSVMVRRDIFEKIGIFDEKLLFEDLDMWLRIAKEYEILFSEYVSVRYRIRQGSLTAAIQWENNYLSIYGKHMDNPDGLLRFRQYVKELYLKGQVEPVQKMAKLSKPDKFINTIVSIAKMLPYPLGYRIVAKMKIE